MRRCFCQSHVTSRSLIWELCMKISHKAAEDKRRPVKCGGIVPGGSRQESVSHWLSPHPGGRHSTFLISVSLSPSFSRSRLFFLRHGSTAAEQCKGVKGISLSLSHQHTLADTQRHTMTGYCWRRVRKVPKFSHVGSFGVFFFFVNVARPPVASGHLPPFPRPTGRVFSPSSPPGHSMASVCRRDCVFALKANLGRGSVTQSSAFQAAGPRPRRVICLQWTTKRDFSVSTENTLHVATPQFGLWEAYFASFLFAALRMTARTAPYRKWNKKKKK